MSRTIDERVVSMQFDNKQFEANVKTSLSTLEKLKQSLHLTGASKGLDDVNAAAKRFSLSPIGSAVESVSAKFSALQVMAVTALANITNSAVNAGKRITSALTIEPIRSGFQEYETQLNAVQTILANTQSKGKTLDDVNAALDELNLYADKTIYNFTEMTRNIGTFTAAGVDLDKSVSSIKGIANLAAVSGSTSQQASTAMYQLSQALAAGKVQLMDWNSVVNAGMGGQLFQDALKRTAKQMGKNVDAMIEKYGSFRESLTQGEWLTAEVLTETLTQLSGAYSEADLIAKGYTREQAKEISELAETAVNAATKVKTFTQLVDTLKEAAQSGWTSTWELIVGDFEEAKELWTNISDVIGGIIGKRANNRNEILKGALVSNWDKLVEGINKAGVSTEQFEDKLRSLMKDDGRDVDKLLKKYGSFEEAFKSGEVSSKWLKKALDELGDTAVDLSKIEVGLKFGDTGEDVKALQQRLKALGYDLGNFGEGGVDGIIGSVTEEAIKAFQKAEGLEVTGVFDEKTIAAMEKAGGSLSKIRSELDGLIDEIDKLGGREMLIESFANIWTALTKPLKAVKEAWDIVFGKIFSNDNKATWLYNLIEAFHNFTKKLVISDAAAERIRNTFVVLFAGIRDGIKWVKDGASATWEWVKSLGELEFVQNIIKKIKDSFSSVVSVIKKIVGPFAKIGKSFIREDSIFGPIEYLYSFADAFAEVKNNIIGFFSTFKEEGDGAGGNMLERIIGLAKSFKDNVVKYFGEAGVKFEEIKEKLVAFLEEAGVNFDAIKEKILGFVTVVKQKLGDHMGTILALGTLVTFLYLAKKIKDAVELLAKPFDMVGDFLENLGGSIKDFASSAKAQAKGKMFESIATSIAILAGAVAVLSLLDQGKVWSSVGAITLLAGVLVAISLVLGKFNTGDFGKLSVSLLGLSGALLVFAIAAKAIGSTDWGALAKCGVVLAAFLGTIMLLSATGASTYLFAEFGKMMLQLSAGLIILSFAIKILGGMDSNVLLQGGTAVVTFMGMMVGMMAATKFLGKELPKFGTTMAALSVSLMLLSISVAILGKMDIVTLIQGGIAVGAFLTIMVGMMAATKLLAKDMPRFGGTMLGLSAGLLFMSGTVLIMGKMDMGTAIKGAIAMVAFIGIMGAMMAATRLLSKHLVNATKVGAMMLAFSGSLLILVGAVALLGVIDEENIAKATSALWKLTGMLSVLLIASKFASDCKGSVVAISIAVAVLAASVAALSFIDPEKLAPAVLAISVLMGMFAVLAASTKNVTKSMGSLIVLVGAVAILAGVVILLSKIPIDTSLPVVASLSLLITSLSIVCKNLGMLPIPAALTAVANLGILLGGLASIVAIAGGIAQIPGADWLMGEGGAFLESIGLAIGRFVGGIIGGLGAGMSAGLPEIGTNLSTFMTNLEPFIDAVSKLDENTMNGIGTLSAMLLSLTGSRLMDAVTKWLTGNSSLADFASELIPFGEKIVEFSGVISPLGEDAINKIGSMAGAVDALVQVADKVPETGGLLQKIEGVPDLVSFSTGLESLGTAIVSFSSTVSTIGEEDISKMASVGNAVEKLADVADKVPETGGIVQKINGVPDMVLFADSLTSLGTALVKFSGSISLVTEDDIAKMSSIAGAVDKLVEISGKIPETGGIAQKITGVPDLNSFATSLTSLGTNVSRFTTTVTAVTEEDIAKITSIGGAVDGLVTLSGKIPAEGGLTQAITGAPSLSSFAGQMATFGGKVAEFTKSVTEVSDEDIKKMTSIGTAAETLVGVAISLKDYNDSVVWNTNLTEFAGQLKTFGVKMAEFEGEIKEIDRSKLTGIASSARVLMRLATDLNDTDMTGLSDFSGELYWFGEGLNDLYSDLADVDTGKLSSAVSSVNTILSIAKGVAGVNFEGLSGFGTALEKIGKTGIDNFIKSFGDAKDRLRKAGGELLTNILKGATSKKTELSKGLTSLLSDAVTAIREKYDSFKSAGKYLVEGLAAGISANTYKAEAKAKAMAEAAVEAAREALKVNSPAKTMIPLGEAIPEGLVLGISNLAGSVKSSAVSMARSAIDGARTAMARITDVINSDVDAQPTIRPVLDLSDVRTGAGAISGMLNMSPTVGVMSNIGAISSMMNSRQNGGNDDVISAIRDLGKSLGGMRGDTYSINGITYDDGSNISDAVKSLVRAARVERRV